MIEDVLVRVRHLIFPADFVVMDIEEDADIPLILGHPFMSTVSCLVDMGKKKLCMKVWKYHILWYLPRRKKIVIWRDFYTFSGNWN